MSNHRNLKIHNLIVVLENTVLLLVCSLPFLVPFSLERNFNLQGLVIILAGALGWVTVFLRKDKPQDRFEKIGTILIALYIIANILNLVANFNSHTLFGSPLMRLGSLGLVACIGCGLALRKIEPKRLIQWLYTSICLIAASAIPYSLLTDSSISRIGGLFSQADILAVFMGVGVLFGIAMWQSYPDKRKYLIVTQLLLIAILVGTQTRSVILLLPLIGLLMVLTGNMTRSRKIQFSGVILSALALVMILSPSLPSSRLTDSKYAGESLSYRRDLQKAGIKSLTTKPLFGYGAGSIENALKCSDLSSSSLKQSCYEGFYFTSSHNIYLDRTLAIGWVGGLAYLAFVIVCLFRGLRSRYKQIQILSYCALLIAIYYLTNVTSIALELLFIILLLRISRV